MDYQFIRNDLNEPTALFSGEHVALGYFLTTELSDNKPKAINIMLALGHLEKNSTEPFEWLGEEYKLSIEQGDVSITALVLDHALYDELPESTQLYDQEQKSECGLYDFRAVLEEWIVYAYE